LTGSVPLPPEALLNAALRLLASRRRGVQELRDRLLRKGFSLEEVETCLSWLEERDLLDDVAFSEALVRDRLRFSPRSPAFLRRELARRGIAPEVAQAAVARILEEEDLSERRLARAAGRQWAAKQGPDTLVRLADREFTAAERVRVRRRLYGFLARKGFRGEAAKEGMEAAETEARKSFLGNN